MGLKQLLWFTDGARALRSDRTRPQWHFQVKGRWQVPQEEQINFSQVDVFVNGIPEMEASLVPFRSLRSLGGRSCSVQP